MTLSPMAHKGRTTPGGCGGGEAGGADRLAEPGVTLPFYTVADCHWLSFLRALHSNLAVIAVNLCQNDSAAPG
jgi:hypothetical protein